MILHIDMDAFYASVEIRDDPSLVGKPVVVGGSPQGRGVISAASYEARRFGIHSAMPAAKAIRLCPNAVFIKPRMEHYAAISKTIREIFFRFTSLVEPLSLDEAFLDVSGCERLFGDGVTIARAIKKTILEETGLVASAGVAPNKFLAKVASDLEKPDGLVVVDPQGVQRFLDPLSISRIWGVGKKTLSRFDRLGVATVKQLRAIPRSVLSSNFGVNSEHFWRLSRGLDTRAVVPDRIAKTISHETTFHSDITNPEILNAWMLELTDQVARRLRRHEIFGRTVQIKVRFADFQTITRSKTIESPTSTTEVLKREAVALLTKVELPPRGVRLLGMGVSNLSDSPAQQLTLFDRPEQEKANRLDEMADQIKDKFGASALKRGTSMRHKIQHRPDPRVDDQA